MRRKLSIFLLHPYFLSVLNLLILILFYSAIKASWFILQPTNHFEEAVELWDGFGTILLGLGVILEERPSLAHILGLSLPAQLRKGEDLIERVCHEYGVIFVVLGVIIELFAWLVKIPNEVLDTYGIEFTFVNIAALAAAIGALLQIKFFFEIVRAHWKVGHPS